MKWNIQIDKIALKFIAKQPAPQRMRIMAAIAKLPEDGGQGRQDITACAWEPTGSFTW